MLRSGVVSMATHRMVSQYVRSMNSWGASDRTIKDRQRIAEQILDLWPDPETATTSKLAEWLGRPNLSQWSRCTYHSHTRAFFGWLVAEGHIETDPTLKLHRPRTPKNKPKPLSDVEQRRVLAAARGNQRAWLMLALYAGLRAHEIAKVKGEDVQEDSIFVHGKGGKDAFIPTHPLLWELAQNYPRRGWWFPSPAHDGHISGNSVTILTGVLFRASGVDGSIHRARHSYGTRLLRAGNSIRVVQELMRHSSLATTAAYCAVDEDERRAAINRLDGVA